MSLLPFAEVREMGPDHRSKDIFDMSNTQASVLQHFATLYII